MSETFKSILNKANEISAKLSSLLKKRNEENEMLNDTSFDEWFDYMLDQSDMNEYEMDEESEEEYNFMYD